MTDEFDLIKTYFKPLAGSEGLGLIDDAACLQPTAGFDLVITKDVLVSDIHFLSDDPADTIAHKALAVNLSDLAAKGAKPKYYLLGLTLPQDIQSSWLAEFAQGLKGLQDATGCKLIGGDTTSSKTGCIVISITAIGEVAENTMITRAGANKGDDVFVTGTLGDAALGLGVRSGDLVSDGEFLVSRYLKPKPRNELGVSLVGTVSASADISDGLLADLGHICTASNLSATIYEDLLPVSRSAEDVLKKHPSCRSLVWSGGDDYELVFTAPKAARDKIQEKSNDFNVLITRIGHIDVGNGVKLLDDAGNSVTVENTGFKHF